VRARRRARPSTTPRWSAGASSRAGCATPASSSGVSGLQLEAVTTVRKKSGELTVTDGPYAETKEVLFSFYIIDVEDLDAALAWAAKMPSAEYGSVEVRPMVGYEAG
jgi:hypothetical protein